MTDPRFTPDMAEYWRMEYHHWHEPGDTPERFVKSLERINTPPEVLAFVREAITVVLPNTEMIGKTESTDQGSTSTFYMGCTEKEFDQADALHTISVLERALVEAELEKKISGWIALVCAVGFGIALAL